MPTKAKPRTKSADELANEREFSRRRSFADSEALFMSGRRYFTVVLMARGRELASKTELITRGKVTSVDYSLPTLGLTAPEPSAAPRDESERAS